MTEKLPRSLRRGKCEGGSGSEAEAELGMGMGMGMGSAGFDSGLSSRKAGSAG